MAASHAEDHTRYQELLESTRDDDGVCHRDHAVKLLGEELAAEAVRVAEYAEARARQVADGFDRTHQPAAANGQMSLAVDTYLVLGDSERVAVEDAMSVHTRQWLDVQNINHARQAAAHAVKTLRGYELLAVQDEHRCSMWDAARKLQGGD